MFLRWVDGKAQVADALTKLHGDGDLLRAVWPSSIHGVGRGTRDCGLPDVQEKRERERVPRVKSPLKLREPVGRNVRCL